MENGGIQPTYNLADRGYGYGDFGGGSGIWLFAILALMWGGNGFFGNNNGRCATTEDLNNTTNFARLESQVRDNGTTLLQKYDNLNNGLASLGYEMAQQFGQVQRDMCAMQAQTTSEIQSVKDMLYQNKIETMQSRINQLELAQATNGLVRYPTAMAYNAGNSPFCNGCCGGCNNI